MTSRACSAAFTSSAHWLPCRFRSSNACSCSTIRWSSSPRRRARPVRWSRACCHSLWSACCRSRLSVCRRNSSRRAARSSGSLPWRAVHCACKRSSGSPAWARDFSSSGSCAWLSSARWRRCTKAASWPWWVAQASPSAARAWLSRNAACSCACSATWRCCSISSCRAASLCWAWRWFDCRWSSCRSASVRSRRLASLSSWKASRNGAWA